MRDSRCRAWKVSGEPGTSYCARKQGSAPRLMGTCPKDTEASLEVLPHWPCLGQFKNTKYYGFNRLINKKALHKCQWRKTKNNSSNNQESDEVVVGEKILVMTCLKWKMSYQQKSRKTGTLSTKYPLPRFNNWNILPYLLFSFSLSFSLPSSFFPALLISFCVCLSPPFPSFSLPLSPPSLYLPFSLPFFLKQKSQM